MKPLPEELTAKIDEIHSWMFDGDLDKVARLSRKSKGWVSKVFNKKVTPNMEVIVAGLQVMNENKVKFEIQPSMKIA